MKQMQRCTVWLIFWADIFQQNTVYTIAFVTCSLCFANIQFVLAQCIDICEIKARIETEQTERGLPRLFISCSCIHNYKLTTKQNSSAPAPASYLRSNEGATFHRWSVQTENYRISGYENSIRHCHYIKSMFFSNLVVAKA